LAMNSRRHSSNVPSCTKYGPVAAVRRWLLSEGHFRRTAGASKSYDRARRCRSFSPHFSPIATDRRLGFTDWARLLPRHTVYYRHGGGWDNPPAVGKIGTGGLARGSWHVLCARVTQHTDRSSNAMCCIRMREHFRAQCSVRLDISTRRCVPPLELRET